MEQPINEEQIMRKYKAAVRNMRWRPMFIAYIFSMLFILYPLLKIAPTSSPTIILLGRISVAFGLLMIFLSIARALQISRWPILLIHATILEKHQVSGFGARYYLRLQPHQAKLFEKKGLSPFYQSLEPELNYMVVNTNPAFFYQSEEGETAQFICVPKSKQILDRV